MYIKSELVKILKSKRKVCFIVLMFLIPFVDLMANMLNVYGDYWLNSKLYENGLSAGMILHPAKGSFLAGTSEGHISQMLLIWVLPIYLMIIYGDSYIREVHEGYNKILFCKVERKKLVKDRFILAFMLPFLISLVSLVVNFILAQVVFYGGTSMSGLELLITSSAFLKWCIQNPNLSYMIYILICSVVSGCCGLICTGIGFLVPDMKISYVVAFFVWLVQIMSPYSITYVVQPFIEYGPEIFIPAFVFCIIVSVTICITAYRYKVKYDEM